MRSAPTTTRSISPCAHERARHAVGDDRRVDAVAHELPRGQARALQERPRLVGEHGDALALLDRGADHAERRAVARRRERAGVAVREDARRRPARPRRRSRPSPGSWRRLRRGSPRLALEPARDLLGRLPRLRRRRRTTRFIRSIAQNRLTAVGRVAAIMSHVFWNSTANCLVPFALLRCMPSAMPIAAATPIAGAPRITIVLIARATSCAVRQRT